MSVTHLDAAGGVAPLRGGMLWLAAVVLAAANFIAVLDMTIANVSVPNIAGSLGISSSQGTWVITSYAVAEAIVVPLTGWLAGRFGAVRVFTSAMALFGLCSALCGMSNSLGMLVVGRVMQGLSGGSLMPLSQTLLLRIFPKEKAAAATALWAMTTLVAPVVGPILGGWLCDSYAWPVIFFINVPLALLCAPIARRMLRRYETPLVQSPIDKFGLVLMIVFITALQLMLDLGKEHDWFESTAICLLAIVAALGFAAFLIWELTERYPIVDLRVFRHRGFAASVVTLSLGFGAVFGVNVLTPLWLQSYMGYTASWAGLTTAWSGVLAVAAAPIAGMLIARVDPRRLIFGGLLWLAAVTALRAVATTDMTYWQIAVPLILMGGGLPFFFVPLTALALGSVEEHETASAAGLQNFLRTLSGAVATSLVTTLWEDRTAYRHEELAGLADRGGDTALALARSGLSPDAVRHMLDSMVQGQSVMLATNQLMVLVAFVFAASACVIWLARRPTRAVDMTQVGH
ncbi:DHA2 family efflux MFS transporter permease subunit [Variovorax fucosicus]|uniref:DHA2 family efflux MFS transporter permease subunit n=1 Tax=Variovorax fucosicus TaxID=3053517 RepID=UPI002574A97A|nr:DHA2 family efflux MFS transporter permease subunit [Variovorax sp. J22G47]MDM0055098.1 DHA2 family efflux MFS transporter permease subunit [Variovorax sp. J22G47]